MAKIRVGINGLGRIGRTLLREWVKRGDSQFDIVAVNNPGRSSDYLHLLQYDSIHGRLQADLKAEEGRFSLNGNSIEFFNSRSPEEVPWDKANVDVVIDSSGRFKTGEALGKHLGPTVKKVILCAPGENVDATVVVGINDKKYDSNVHHIISNASCTTNCLAPVVKVLQDKWGIQSGHMTTVHAYTADQSLLDSAHKDLRRARAAAMSMIPTSTGAAKAIGTVIPELKGKLDGFAVRVPTPDVSMVDLSVVLNANPSKEEINRAMLEASAGELKGILAYNDSPLVSIDFTGTPESSVFDAGMTNVMGNHAKIVAWYDNEVGFSNRVLDLAAILAERSF